MSLGRRLRQPRTIISLILPIFLLILFAGALPGFHLDELPALILGANRLAAARRVRRLLPGLPAPRPALGDPRPRHRLSAPASATRPRSSSSRGRVNCLVPAKLGDLYRAYLLKINSPVSLSRTFGTVFIERVLDLFAIVVLGLGAGYWCFRSGLPTEVQIVFAIGVIVVVVLAVGPADDAQLRPAADHPPAVAAQRPRAVRPVRGGRLRGARAQAAADARRRHRPHLGDRGDAAVPRRRGDGLPATSTSGSAARSSWR